MRLSKAEMRHIYECIKETDDNGGIKDHEFITAFKKIKYFYNCNADYFNVCEVTARAVHGKRYSDLSPEAANFIKRRISEGYKNTYHSLMAVLESRRKRIDSTDELREKDYRAYVNKYKIEDADIPVFDEIFECAFNNFSAKLQSR